jgi:acyl dehydratase
VSGGEGLAANASFDPQYSRAKNYIRNHPVGPAVLSPILIQGLIGALVEATLPQSFFVENRLKQIRPLIVGVEVEASIEIVSILPSTGRREVFKYDDSSDRDNSDSGYRVNIDTMVRRVSDGQLIAEGEQVVWMPDYCLEKDQ